MLLSCCVIVLLLIFVVLIWFSFGLLLITKGVKEKKRDDQEKAGTLLHRVREAKEEKQHLVDLQTRNQIPRPYGEERLLKVQAIPIRDVNNTTSASKLVIIVCIGPRTPCKTKDEWFVYVRTGWGSCHSVLTITYSLILVIYTITKKFLLRSNVVFMFSFLFFMQYFTRVVKREKEKRFLSAFLTTLTGIHPLVRSIRPKQPDLSFVL